MIAANKIDAIYGDENEIITNLRNEFEKDGIKVLGNGELTKKLTVKASKFSASAKAAIEAAGGTAEVM